MPLPDRLQAVVDLLEETSRDKYGLANELDITPSTVRDRIASLRDNGINIQFDHTLNEYHLPEQDAHRSRDEINDKAILSDLENGVTVATLCDNYDTKESVIRTILEELSETTEIRSHDTDEGELYYRPDGKDKRYSLNEPDGEHTIAIISDTHLGSEAEHLDELHDFYDRCTQHGVEHVFHCGDISDGWKVHQGHLNEIKEEAAGWGNLRDYVVENYPQRDGITTHFVEGNHDNKFYNRHNIHFGKLLAQDRDDLHYCGNSQATFDFDRNGEITLELIHPSGGKPYTTGYRLQTLYRERNVDERPTIAAVGHLHGMMYADTEGVRGFYAGAWKGTTTYGKRKGHQAKIGGWILDLEIQDGFLKGMTMHEQRYPERATQNNYDVENL